MKKVLWGLVTAVSVLICVSGVYSQDLVQVSVVDPTATVTYQKMVENQLLVSVSDSRDNPVLGLGVVDFIITSGGKSAKVLKVEPLQMSAEVGLNIVLVVDNSYSMKERKAIGPLLSALERFYAILRPIDTVYGVVFDEKNTIEVNGRNLHVKTIKTSDIVELKNFFSDSLDRGLSNKTFLNEAMYAGVDIIKGMPPDSNKFMITFSDGEDLNSAFKSPVVEKTGEGIQNFEAYSVDYMPGPSLDAFLKSFAESHGGKIWKAASAADLMPIFQAFSTKLLHRYVVTYRMFEAPSAIVAMEPFELTIEEVTTIDSSPLLNHVYFDTGKREIPGRYVLFSDQGTANSFSEERLKGTMEKYLNVLNIIGKRLVENPDAFVTLVGCNSNTGEERGNIELSRGRGEAVRAYLRYIWGISPSRIEIKAQNLPDAASTGSTPDGRADNQRVEIYSSNPAILGVIKSSYVQEVTETKVIRIRPQMESEIGVASWKINLMGEGTVLASVEGNQMPETLYSFDIGAIGAGKIAAFKNLSAAVEITDKEGGVFREDAAATTPVRVVRREERLAQKLGYRVLEKYALILFDFDKAEIKDRNKVIIDSILSRLKNLPTAEMRIVGHTDTIGMPDYNVKLSERRAKAVYDQVIAAGAPPQIRISHRGEGPYNPLYDNGSPEGRALNRTVTVDIEYEQGS